MTGHHPQVRHGLMGAATALLEPLPAPIPEQEFVDGAALVPSESWWTQPGAIAAAAVATILILFGGLLPAVIPALEVDRRAAEAVDSPPAMLPSPVATTAAGHPTTPAVAGSSFDTVLTADMLSSGWERLENTALMDLVIELPDGFVGFGSSATETRPRTFATRTGLFASNDGLTWTRSTDDGRTVGSVVALTAADDGIVALAEDTFTAEQSVVHGASRWGTAVEVEEVIIWHSAAGRSWTMVPLGIGTILDPGNRAPWIGYEAVGLASAAGRFVAAVTEHPDDSPARMRTLVFLSEDGTTWARPAVGDVFDGAAVTALTGHAGGFVMLGYRLGAATIWWSSDGASWQWAPAATVGFGPEARLMAIASTAHGFIAAGSMSGRPAIWASSDGIRWDNAAMEIESGADYISSVVTAGHNVFAVGESEDGRRRLCFLSTDGTGWDRVDLDPAAFAPYEEAGRGMRSPSIGYFYGAADALVATGDATWIWRGPPTLPRLGTTDHR